jgi:hypothetical protein
MLIVTYFSHMFGSFVCWVESPSYILDQEICCDTARSCSRIWTAMGDPNMLHLSQKIFWVQSALIPKKKKKKKLLHETCCQVRFFYVYKVHSYFVGP